ncbi:hypothetical protein CK203_068886 [Vitis vinifera]|uniref:GAG-pre-integrase domain-containing protein n=1 Tax=Vitis vinifera TaxID=29760 RepID=A0A438EXU8_VITVI|nr:hypothetical protein CK203_068886 [Vitis vinifera]
MATPFLGRDLCVPWEGLFFISSHFSPLFGSQHTSENYLSWSAFVELWFMGQGYEDHLVTPEDAIPDVDKTLSTNGSSDSSVLVSQTNSRGGRSDNRGRGQCPQCTYCNKLGHTRDHCYQLHGRSPCTAHIAQSSYPLLSRPDSAASSTSQSITLTSSDYDAYLRYQAATSASVTQTGNVSVCFTQSHSLGSWILDSGASSHISSIGLAHPLPSLLLHSVLYAPECPFNLISISKITHTLNCSIIFSDKFVILQDRSMGKTIGIGRESQALYHLTSPSSPATCIFIDAHLLIHNRLGHPSLSKFQKMVPRFSTLSSLACESCQLGKHTCISFPKRLNNRAKSPLNLSTLMFGVHVGPRLL